jgi:hypothetical protein
MGVGLAPCPASAHSFAITDALIVLKTDGTYQVDVTVDVDALALGLPDSTDSYGLAAELSAMAPAEFTEAVERARQTIGRRVRIRFDDVKQDPTITFPQYGTPLATESRVPTVLGVKARLEGRVPEGAKSLTFFASRAFAAVHLTIYEQATGVSLKYPLGRAEEAPPFQLNSPAEDRSTVRSGFVPARYVVLGFEHIIPEGLDHILFVLGLFLLSTKLRPLLWQVTAFTIAHSVTLALSMFDVVSLPSRVVEPLIALSIACVAIENLLTTQLKPWRPAVVFGFGLLHGLGFASVLRDIGLPREQFAAALIGFNVGVELGQLSVVLLAFLAVGWFRKAPWYRNAIVIPLSAAIALIGLYWAVQRAFFLA